MKKIISIILASIFMVTISACGNAAGAGQLSETESSTLGATALSSGTSPFTDVPEGITSGKADNRFAPKDNITRAEAAGMLYRWLNGAETTDEESGGKTLVAYFSATGTTRPLAEYAADILDADLYEIVPKEPYTQADLTYYSGGRADKEQGDSSARPAISGNALDMAQYDVILLGYPIWHGEAPKIISTFLESYDFSGKTIVPFCTSHSSGSGSSAANLHALALDANWLPGQRFAGGTSKNAIEEWIGGLDLPEATSTAAPQRTFDFETADQCP